VYGVAALGTLPRASANAGEHGLTVAQLRPRRRRGRECRELGHFLRRGSARSNIIVKASVPGVNPEDLDVSILRWAKTTQDKEENIL
jgi:hypothetical protein